jgi:hypothetical protein
VLTTLPVEVSIVVRVFWTLSVTKASLPSALKVTEVAPAPTGTVWVTLPVAASTIATWLVGWSAVTNRVFPFGAIAMSVRCPPTGSRLVSLLVAKSITETSPLPWLAT